MNDRQVTLSATEYRLVKAPTADEALIKARAGFGKSSTVPFFVTDEDVAEAPVDLENKLNNAPALPGMEV